MLIPAVVALATLAVFSPALDNGFVDWDDELLLTKNPHYRGVGWAQLSWSLSNMTMGHYVPVTWITFGLDHVLWGMDPAGYHLTNLLLHAANAALFYLLALRLLRAATAFRDSTLRLASTVSALFFALHPLRAESVAWVTERRDVLSGFFFFLTLLVYLEARDRTGAARVRRHLVACLCYLLAILSKSIVMTLPALLVLLDIYPFRRLGPRPASWLDAGVWREKVPYMALGLVAGVLAYYAQASSALFSSFAHGWEARPALVAYGTSFYVSKTVMPVHLSVLYELPATIHVREWRFLGSIVAVTVAVVLLVLLRRRWPAGLAVAASYGLLISPVVGIVHSGYQLAHDRYSYLACLGFALLIGGGAGWIVAARARGILGTGLARAAGVAYAAWLGTLGILTWHQVQVWHDSETLWQYAVDAEPECTVCLYNEAVLLYNRGRHELARQRFERVKVLGLDQIHARGRLGSVYVGLEDFPRAATEYQARLARMPDDVESRNTLGVIWTALGRPRDAVRELRWALRLEDNPVYRANLALALLDLGEPRAGLAEAERAAAQRPDLVAARIALALAHRDLGDLAAARHQHTILRALEPAGAALLGPALITAW